MSDISINARPVSPSEQIPFRCIGCGTCCRGVKQSVPLESLDVFRIAKYLRERKKEVRDIEDFLEQYAEPAVLDECGFFVLFLKVQGKEDSCIFLKDNRCTLQPVKPRACRMYPVTAEPTKSGLFRYMVSQEQSHHFKGSKVSVKRWMKQYFYPEEREALHMDYLSVPNIVRLLRKVPEEQQAKALSLFWFYRYSSFELDTSFLEQYKLNLARLQAELSRLAGEI